MKIIGLENIPKDGPALLVANHRSFLDPACLGSASPRKVHFLITNRVYSKFMQTWFYRWMETIPIQGSSADLSAIRLALRRLNMGEVIGIFPEGGRAAEMQLSNWMHGVALIAARSGSPLIPVAIVGTDRALGISKFMPKPLSIRVVFGKSINFPAAERKSIKRKSLISFSTMIFKEIQNLTNEFEVKSRRASCNECRDYNRGN